VGRHAAVEKGVELVPQELRQVGAGCGLSLLEEGGGVLLHEAVWRGLLRWVALVMDWAAVGHPSGLPVDGLNTRLPRL